MATDPVAQLTSLQKRVELVKTSKARKEQELILVNQQLDDLLLQTRSLGVECLEDLPSRISQLEAELNQMVTEIQTQLYDAEKVLGLTN